MLYSSVSNCMCRLCMAAKVLPLTNSSSIVRSEVAADKLVDNHGLSNLVVSCES